MDTGQFTDSNGLTHTFHCMPVEIENCGGCVQFMTQDYEAAGRTVHNTIGHSFDEIQDCGSQYMLEVIWSDA